MQIFLSLNHIISHIQLQFCYQLKNLCEKCNINQQKTITWKKNVVLGKDFNLGMIGFFFMLSSNLHARQKRNEKKALDQLKKKMKLKWDELQSQAQQMEQVKWPLLVCLTSKMLLGIIGILPWGVKFIPQSAWVCLEKDEILVETVWASKVAYAKFKKVAWGT